MPFHDQDMLHDNYKHFLKRIVEKEAVWGLKNEQGYAFCESNDDETRDVLVFWSDKSYAERARKELFQEYIVSEISLFDFIFRWLPGMQKDSVLVGPNWTGDLAGLEIAPEELQNSILDTFPKPLLKKYIQTFQEVQAQQKE